MSHRGTTGIAGAAQQGNLCCEAERGLEAETILTYLVEVRQRCESVAAGVGSTVDRIAGCITTAECDGGKQLPDVGIYAAMRTEIGRILDAANRIEAHVNRL